MSLVEHILSESPERISFIIDAEIVAVDSVDGSLKSFQELSNRARKDVKLDDVKVSVGVFAFDLMYLDRQVHVRSPFSLGTFLTLGCHGAAMLHRCSWSGPSANGEPCYAVSFRSVHHKREGRRGYAMLRAVRAKTGAQLLKNSGRWR